VTRWKRYSRLLIANRRAGPGHLDALAQYLALDAALAGAWAKGALPKNSHLARHYKLANMLGLVDDGPARPTMRPAPTDDPAEGAPNTRNKFYPNWLRGQRVGERR
jgi:hypothetical protein